MKDGFLFMLIFYYAFLIHLLDNFSYFIPFKFILFDETSFKYTRYIALKDVQLEAIYFKSFEKTYNFKLQYNLNHLFKKKSLYLENNKSIVLFSIKIIKKILKFKHKTNLSSSLLKTTELTSQKNFYNILLCTKKYKKCKKTNINVIFNFQFLQKIL
nr:hypothetical protein Cry52Nrm3_p112 [Cryptomonas curvata]